MIAWQPALVDDYCSSWSVIQLLEWLNNTRATWLSTVRAWKFEMRYEVAMLPDEHATKTSGTQAEIVDVIQTLSQRRRWLQNEHLRYCPVCIRSGMHYPYQQDHGFRRCILHLKPLQQGCPLCGGDIDTKGRLIHAFTCSRCNGSVLADDAPGLRTSLQRTFDADIHDRLESWIADSARLSQGYQQPGTGSAWGLWGVTPVHPDPGWYWRALTFNPDSRIAAALEPTPESFRILPIYHYSNRVRINTDCFHAEEIVDPYLCLLRAMSRHLRHTELRAHRACVRCATVLLGGMRQRLPAETYIYPRMCCLGQAYALWRLQWAGEFRRMVRALTLSSTTSEKVERRLPSAHAAQLSFSSSFHHWVDVLATIQAGFVGPEVRVVLDGIADSPHWSLLQRRAYFSSPIHFRNPHLHSLGQCDRGAARDMERERVSIVFAEIEKHRKALRGKQRPTDQR